MKRIVFVTMNMGAGGAEASLLMLLHQLADRENVQVDLLLLKKEGMFLEQIPKKIRILEPDVSLRAAYLPFSFQNCKTLRGVLLSVLRPISTVVAAMFSKSFNHRNQLRWIHCYKYLVKPLSESYDYACGYLDGEATYYVVDKIKAHKKFGWNHNDYPELQMDSKIDTAYFAKLDTVATISDRCTAILSEAFPEHRHKMRQTPNIVTAGYLRSNAQAYYPTEFTTESGIKLLSVGRLVEQKGFDMALEAAAELNRKKLDFKWFIIGEGHLRPALEKSIRELSLQDRVYLLGQRANPYPYIANADIFVQPSRFEGKSIVLTEAKLLGKPIVATNYTTVSDQLTNGVDGVIVDMEPTAIADGIVAMAKNEQLRRKLQANLAAVAQTDTQEAAINLALFELA